MTATTAVNTTQVYQVFIKTTPEQIWEAITTPEFTARYFHSARITYWGKLTESGKVVVYGPARDSTGAWGLAVIEADSDADVRAIAREDPAISSGMATFDVGTMAVAIVRA